MIFPRHLRVEDSSQSGEARRLVEWICRELGFDAACMARAALVVTELATNILKHTGAAAGELVFTPTQDSDGNWLDILSLDQGPGIANIGESLRDGQSTAGSLGTGLGAIRRQSDWFDIYSSPGHGAAVFSRIGQRALQHDLKHAGINPSLESVSNSVPNPMSVAAGSNPAEMSVGAVCLPVHGEAACGDAWGIKRGGDTTLFLLADGLGHGPDAAAAANLAVTVFTESVSLRPAELLHLIHAALRGTRGAAVLVVQVAGVPELADATEAKVGGDVVRYAGVGNLSGAIVAAGASRSMVSHYGTAGVEARWIQEFTLPWPQGGLLVMHSDGVATRWSLDDYPGLARHHPALIAGVLYRDHQRQHDDSTVVVARAAAARSAP